MAFVGSGLEVFADNTAGTVTSGGTTAPAAGTVESWTVTVTAAFPVASASALPSSYFYVADPAVSAEVILVTVNPGGTGAGQTWTVTRGADGTVPLAHAAGFVVNQVLCGQSLRVFQPLNKFTVTDYGADPSGVADSTSAFQAALNAAGVNGGLVFVPSGTFLITPPSVTVPALTVPANVTLGGAGFNSSVLRKNANGILLDFSGQGPNPQTQNFNRYQGLTNVAIDGNNKTGLLLRLYYVQSYIESNVYLHDNADVFVDMAQCYDSRVTNGLYLNGGSVSASAISGGQACVHLIRNSAAPSTTLTTALTSGVSSGTSLAVVALDAALPAGIVQVWNAAPGNPATLFQNFVTTGAAAAATSIPVTAQVANATYAIGNVVNGFGWSSDNTNNLIMQGCHWEAQASGSIWMTAGIDPNVNSPLNNIFITSGKIEQDFIQFNCPQVQIDTGNNINIEDLFLYGGGFSGAYSTPVTGIYFRPASGMLRNIYMNTGAAVFSSGIDAGVWWMPGLLQNIRQEWGSFGPTVAGISVTGGKTHQIEHFFSTGTVTTPIAVSGGGSYTLDNGKITALLTGTQAVTSTTPSTATDGTHSLAIGVGVNTYKLTAFVPYSSAGTTNTPKLAFTGPGTSLAAFRSWFQDSTATLAPPVNNTTLASVMTGPTLTASSAMMLTIEGVFTFTGTGTLALSVFTSGTTWTVMAGAYMTLERLT